MLKVRVSPNASRNGWGGLRGDEVKLAITAPPVEGKANRAVVRFVARAFSLSRGDVALVGGETSRSKKLLLRGVTVRSVVEQISHQRG